MAGGSAPRRGASAAGRKRSRPAAPPTPSSSGGAAAAAAAAPALPAAVRVPTPRLVFGAISGALGVVIALPPATHALLGAAQEAMARVVQGVGGLSHGAWREFFTEQRPPAYLAGGGGGGGARAPPGIIDGDFLEMLLDLQGAQQEAVAEDMGRHGAPCSVSHLLGVIDHLASMH